MKLLTLTVAAMMAATPVMAQLVFPSLSYRTGPYAAANGEVFNNIFNYPANYWDGASIAINYLLSENDGSLEGKKIALLYHNSAYGKEPIRTLQELSAKHGFELTELPVDHPGQEQKSQWLQIRREQPDYVIMWGWGVMNQVAIQEAANIRYPMDQFIGNWWAGSENDVLPVGDAADGYKALAMHNVGTDFPIFADLEQYVTGAGKAAGNGDQVGTVLYNRGFYAAMLAAEAVKKAQEIHGEPNITPAMMRDGMEALVIDEALMESLGMPNFGPAFTVSCQDHGGSGQGKVQQWDASAKEWKIITDWIESDASVIDPLIAEDSAAYAAENNVDLACQ